MKATTATVILAALCSWPQATARLHFLQISSPLAVSTEKNHPPHIAFVESGRTHVDDEWDLASRKPATILTAGKAPPILVKMETIRLPKMLISRAEEAAPAVISQTNAPNPAAPGPKVSLNDEEFAGLSYADRSRLEQAEARFGVLEQSWNDEQPAVVQKNPAQQAVVAPATVQPVQQTAPSTVVSIGGVKPAPVRPAGAVFPQTPAVTKTVAQNSPPPVSNPAPVVHSMASLTPASSDETFVNAIHLALSKNNEGVDIAGELGIQGGLEYGPGRSLEVVRREEGIDGDQGIVNVKDGTYSIHVSSRVGQILARLRDTDGHILGEGSFYLAQLQGAGPKIEGPTLALTPRTDISGRVVPLYEGQRIVEQEVTAFSGNAKVQVARSGEFELNQIQKGSYSLMHAEARAHVPTVALVSAGSRADLTVFPVGWIDSLKKIVSEQKRMSLDDPESPIVWGRVSQDGKARAGLKVEMESATGVETIYFNQFLLPDPNLTATSDNGYFAIIGAPEGFQSLMATSGEAYFAHQNIVVEPGAVSVAELANTLRTQAAPIRVFDAFAGTPQTATLLHQGADQEIAVDETGASVLTLPLIHRVSLVQVRPESPYVPATYLMNDDEGYMHIPLVRDDWIRAMQSFSKIDDVPESSVAVGFVPDEDFTVDVIDPVNHFKVLMFDAQGNPVEGERGPRGGGFLVIGLSEGVREILVTGESSKQVASRVFPADVRAVTVLTYHAD